jgi:two-component system chemotaxis response regulator CheB
MPPTFTKSLADRLNQLSQVTVREAADRDPIEPGVVLIAPGGKHLTVKKQGIKAYAVVSTQPAETLYHPCVDVLMNSVADSYGRSTMGVILTGMGNNGVIGLKNVKSKGGVVIAQDEATSVVYGMPRAAAEAGVTDHIVPIEDVAIEILNYF